MDNGILQAIARSLETYYIRYLIDNALIYPFDPNSKYIDNTLDTKYLYT
jgi:hypothetical protein